MLTILNFLKKNNNLISKGIGENIRIHKRDIPMNKEWFNSLYHFNKNVTRAYPTIYDYVLKLLKWYFNAISNNWGNIKARGHRKIHRFSGYKIWISNPEMKHYSNRINITIYVYNNTYNFLKKKLEFLQFAWGSTLSLNKQTILKEKISYKKFRSTKQKFPIYLGTNKTIYSTNYDYYKQIIRWLKLNKYIYLSQYKSDLLNISKYDEQKKIKLLNSIEEDNYNYLINNYNKELLYLKYRQKLLFNQFKFNEVYISTIIKFLQNIYNKNIEFNIVTLKYYWLSASIFLQILSTKVKHSKSRGRYRIPLNYAMNRIQVPILSRNKLTGENTPYIGVQNLQLSKFNTDKKDSLNEFLLINSTQSNMWSPSNTDGLVLTNLENKSIVGVSIKIAGRLTKRYKAQRAIKKWKFKGALKNVYSAYRNYSSSVSRGYSNINVEKVKIDSKVRIGAFGLTGWIASY